MKQLRIVVCHICHRMYGIREKDITIFCDKHCFFHGTEELDKVYNINE